MPEAARRPPSARRALTDFLRPGRSQLVIGLVLLVCGLMVVVQLQATARDDRYGSLRRADLVAMLDDLTAQSRRLESEVATLETAKRRLQSGAESQEVARREAEERLASLQIMAGTVAARGPGVRITVTDPQSKVTPEILLTAINELRDAGAEVIELNDSVRVVADSWVGSSASGLIVDGRAVSRPVVLEAIGNSATLAEAARFRGGLVSQVEGSRVGGSVALEQVVDLEVPSIRSVERRQFTRPA